MLYLEDITKMVGGKIPPVHITHLVLLVKTYQISENVRDLQEVNQVCFIKRYKLSKK